MKCLRPYLKIVLVAALVTVPTEQVAALGNSNCDWDAAIKECKSAGNATVPVATDAGTQNAAVTVNAAAQVCNASNDAVITCLSKQKTATCNSCPLNSALSDTCKKKLDDENKKATDQKNAEVGSCSTAGTAAQNVKQLSAADTPSPSATPASTPSGGQGAGGGLGGMFGGNGMGMLMAAGVGAIAGYMFGKNQNKNDNNQLQPYPYAGNTGAYGAAMGTLQADGSLNCAMMDSYNYPECDQYLMGMCASQNPGAVATTTTTAVTGITMMPTAGGASYINCQGFNQRYCSSSVQSPTPMYDQLPSGGTEQIAVGGAGEGLGTPYCVQLQAGAFCSNPAYGAQRFSCPSCLQLSNTQTVGCAGGANPTACMSAYSSSQIASARTSCPDDPIFANPSNSYMGTGASTAPAVLPLPSGSTGTTTAGISTTGAPPAVLPQSSSVATGLAGSTAGANAGTRTVATSLNSSLTSVTSSAGIGASSGAGAVNSTGGRTGTLDRIAGTGSGASAASAARGLASANLEGAYGTSLFSSTSQVIRDRCNTGKLNCP